MKWSTGSLDGIFVEDWSSLARLVVARILPVQRPGGALLVAVFRIGCGVCGMLFVDRDVQCSRRPERKILDGWTPTGIRLTSGSHGL
ncbi:hypothetical protein [Parafrankia discariae]|uniref:hypothetical protein n=1 Tax=Parafrankia discariae TaxID=365528 RepID=UPI0012B699D7|nr:hypothetical protein [Parafrankia discariae]